MRCRSHRQSFGKLTLLLLPFFCAGAALGCGLFFPNDFLVNGGSDLLSLPALSFEYEVYHILGQPPLIGPPPPKTSYDDPDPAAKAIVEKDAAQLHDALLAASMPAEKVQGALEEYRKMRTAMCDQARNHRDWAAQVAERKLWANGGYTPGEVIPTEPPAFEMTPYEPLLARLPVEFAMYVRAAAAYQNRDYEAALQGFTQILDLPAEQRPYRTVWATYMRGMALLRLERYSDAMTAYAGVAKLVHGGFADPLLLANESTGWVAHIKLKQGAIAEAVELYLGCYANGDTAQRQSAILSLEIAMNTLNPHIQADQVDLMIGNERLRNVLVARRICGGEHPEKGDNDWLLAKLQALPQAAPLPYTDRIAWLAYQAADFDAAKHWLQLSPADSSVSMYVQSKLLLRDGKLPEAAELLGKLAKVLEQSQNPEESGAQDAPKWYAYGTEDSLFVPRTPDRLVNLDLGMVLFQRAAVEPTLYAGALDAFLKAGSPFDAASVAEHAMPLEELVAYASKLAPVAEAKERSYREESPDIRYLCARRLARERSLEQAIPFYPGPMQDKANSLMADLKAGKDPVGNARERAAHLVAAARVTREQGMELYGTALCPDWFSMEGMYDLTSDAVPWCQDSPAIPNKRFHYRYVAADLMWEAAQLLPNNDPLTATALYEGGCFLKNRDPEAADRFYKALVRRNPNLAVAQRADKLRWFPRTFDGSVVYRHLSRFALTPKRIGVFVAVAVSMVVIVIALGVIRRKMRALSPAN